MHDTRLSGGVELSGTKASKTKTTIRSVSILASVIDIEVTKTATSFLADQD